MVTTEYLSKDNAIRYLATEHRLQLSLGPFSQVPSFGNQSVLSKNYEKEQELMEERGGKVEINNPSIAPILINKSKTIGSVLVGKGHVINYFTKNDQLKGVPENLSANYEFLKIRVDEPIFGNRKVFTTKIQLAYSEQKNIFDIYRRNHTGLCLPFLRWRGESVCIWLNREKEYIPLEKMVNLSKIPINAQKDYREV